MLHLDASPVYGDLWSGLTLKEYCTWAREHKQYWSAKEPEKSEDVKENETAQIVEGSLDVYRDFVVLSSPEFSIEEGGYIIDLAPKVGTESRNCNQPLLWSTDFLLP